MFLVTNGQYPHSIKTLQLITQLYVSVDAPTPEILISIDRPLFNDAWDRLKQSLSLLKEKGQQTVARLTVVNKGFNLDDVEGSAKLIALSHVSLVKVKGVTFCRKSNVSNLNMSNTPWHHNVFALTQNLQKELAKLHQEVTRLRKALFTTQRLTPATPWICRLWEKHLIVPVWQSAAGRC
jgi:tRNA wybutosine-synthesizing protein 1